MWCEVGDVGCVVSGVFGGGCGVNRVVGCGVGCVVCGVGCGVWDVWCAV